MRSTHSIGQSAEDVAAAFLAERGFKVLDRNVRTLGGELDLICRDGSMLVFVEVKFRSGPAFGSPEEAVTRRKLLHLRRAISSYLNAKPHRGPYRLDVLAIEGTGASRIIRHLRDVG